MSSLTPSFTDVLVGALRIAILLELIQLGFGALWRGIRQLPGLVRRHPFVTASAIASLAWCGTGAISPAHSIGLLPYRWSLVAFQVLCIGGELWLTLRRNNTSVVSIAISSALLLTFVVNDIFITGPAQHSMITRQEEVLPVLSLIPLGESPRQFSAGHSLSLRSGTTSIQGASAILLEVTHGDHTTMMRLAQAFAGDYAGITIDQHGNPAITIEGYGIITIGSHPNEDTIIDVVSPHTTVTELPGEFPHTFITRVDICGNTAVDAYGTFQLRPFGVSGPMVYRRLPNMVTISGPALPGGSISSLLQENEYFIRSSDANGVVSYGIARFSAVDGEHFHPLIICK